LKGTSFTNIGHESFLSSPGPWTLRGPWRSALENSSQGSELPEGEAAMSKSQDAKKNVKKAPSKTPKEKKEAKRIKKAGKN